MEMGREVAIKVLEPPGGADAARKRFLREARLLASVNHPAVAQVYEGGMATWPVPPHPEVEYLVLEYVPGRTLASWLRSGPPTVAEAIRIARGILDGLAALHDRGIVHRDVKPANIMLLKGHGVKVLDMGVARWSREARDSILNPDEIDGASAGRDDGVDVTARGEVVGTPGYMAPEQLAGGPVDVRCDVWAFGLLMLELLSGRRPSRSGADLGACLTPSVDPTAADRLRGPVPPRLRELIRRCLAPSPEERYHHARDVLHDLEVAEEELAGPGTARNHRRKGVVTAALAVAAVAVAALTLRGPHGASLIPPSAGVRSLSLDGEVPFLSPDGRWILYRDATGHKLLKAGVGTPRIETVYVGQPVGRAVISPDGAHVLMGLQRDDGGSELWEAPFLGGPARRLTSGRAPVYSPDGAWVAFLDESPGRRPAVFRCRRDGSLRREVYRLEGPLTPKGLAFGNRGRSLWLSLTDEYHQTLVTRVDVRTGHGTKVCSAPGWAQPGLAVLPNDKGVVFPLVLDAGEESTLAVCPRQGGRAVPFWAAAAEMEDPSMSRDGRLLAVRTRYGESHLVSVPVHPGGGGMTEAGDVLGLPMAAGEPRVTPDAVRLAFTTAADGIWSMNLHTGRILPVVVTGDVATNPAWSPDGRRLAYSRVHEGRSDLWIASASGGDSQPLTNDPANDFHPVFHPDGRHLLFVSDRDGLEDLYRLDIVSGRIDRIGSDGAVNPAISHDGRRLALVHRTGGETCELRIHVLSPAIEIGKALWHTGGRCNAQGGFHPRFSPDDRWLAFERSAGGGHGDLFAVEMSTLGPHTSVRRLTRFAAPVSLASWFDWAGPGTIVAATVSWKAHIEILGDATHWIQPALQTAGDTAR